MNHQSNTRFSDFTNAVRAPHTVSHSLVHSLCCKKKEKKPRDVMTSTPNHSRVDCWAHWQSKILFATAAFLSYCFNKWKKSLLNQCIVLRLINLSACTHTMGHNETNNHTPFICEFNVKLPIICFKTQNNAYWLFNCQWKRKWNKKKFRKKEK